MQGLLKVCALVALVCFVSTVRGANEDSALKRVWKFFGIGEEKQPANMYPPQYGPCALPTTTTTTAAPMPLCPYPFVNGPMPGPLVTDVEAPLVLTPAPLVAQAPQPSGLVQIDNPFNPHFPNPRPLPLNVVGIENLHPSRPFGPNGETRPDKFPNFNEGGFNPNNNNPLGVGPEQNMGNRPLQFNPNVGIRPNTINPALVPSINSNHPNLPLPFNPNPMFPNNNNQPNFNGLPLTQLPLPFDQNRPALLPVIPFNPQLQRPGPIQPNIVFPAPDLIAGPRPNVVPPIESLHGEPPVPVDSIDRPQVPIGVKPVILPEPGQPTQIKPIPAEEPSQPIAITPISPNPEIPIAVEPISPEIPEAPISVKPETLIPEKPLAVKPVTLIPEKPVAVKPENLLPETPVVVIPEIINPEAPKEVKPFVPDLALLTNDDNNIDTNYPLPLPMVPSGGLRPHPPGPLNGNGFPLRPIGLPLGPDGLPIGPNGLPLPIGPDGLPVGPNNFPFPIGPNGRPIGLNVRPLGPDGRPIGLDGQPITPIGNMFGPNGLIPQPIGLPLIQHDPQIKPGGFPLRPNMVHLGPDGRPVGPDGSPFETNNILPHGPEGWPFGPNNILPLGPNGRPLPPNQIGTPFEPVVVQPNFTFPQFGPNGVLLPHRPVSEGVSAGIPPTNGVCIPAPGPFVPPGFHLVTPQNVCGQQQPVEPPPCSMLEMLQRLRLRTFSSLIRLSGLESMFNDTSKYTLFVPVDVAFELLPRWFLESLIADKSLLQNFLLTHFVQADVTLSSLGHEYLLLNRRPKSHRLKFTISFPDLDYPIYMVDAATVLKGDILTQNGHLNIIDKVLKPNPARTAADYLKDVQDLTTFRQAVQDAGMLSYLLGKNPVTLFVPHNKAFNKLEFNQLLQDKIALTNFVKYHMVNGTNYSGGLQNGQYLTTNYLKEIKVTVATDGLSKYLSLVNGYIKILKSDITVMNAVIHIIEDCISTEALFYSFEESNEFKHEFEMLRRNMNLAADETD